ncbi:PREDICTED: poly [ADP-ribose] polymerase 10 [Myotis brandtii]|uniref:poly [ADP-ribose] polymerase 10 n=1 Tax=Myotis brandtii TaxID=109478 RepID=UPI000704220E|nr:PREDICTED: poly [ADP-ribose] polymerase 10 [Myotis brandtii]
MGGGGQGSVARGSWILKVKPGCEHCHGPRLHPHLPFCDEDSLHLRGLAVMTTMTVEDGKTGQVHRPGREPEEGVEEAEEGCAGKHLPQQAWDGPSSRAVVAMAEAEEGGPAVELSGLPPDIPDELLTLYFENHRRSGGGPVLSWQRLPGPLGTVVSFQQWQVAERVLQQDHRLQGSELNLVPHYDVLEPEELAADASGGDHSAKLGSGATEHAFLEAGEPARALEGVGAVTLGSKEAPGQSGAPSRTEPIGSLGQAAPVSSGPVGSSDQRGLESLGLPGSSGQAEPVSSRPAESPGPVGSVENALGPPEQMGSGSLEPGAPPEQEGLVEMVLSMEPGTMRFMQLYYEDLLAGLGDVALFPLEESDMTGFRLCGALAPCQAAEEFLQSLLGSISYHVLSLKLPGSARFLRGPEGQHLLRELEAQFQCVFGTERLAGDALDTDPAEVDPTEALQALPGQAHTPWPPDSTGRDPENLSLEEVRELLATLEGLDREDWLPLEPGEEEPEEQPEEEQPEEEQPEEEPVAPSTGGPEHLEEEAALQLALHRSLGPQGQEAEQEEAAALQRALALSLLEPTPLEAEEEFLGGGPGGQAQLVVHVDFEQDMDELDRALRAALEAHLREETVGLRGHTLPAELLARLERRHGVSVALHDDRAVLRGFGAQPTRAACHLRALLAGPWGQSVTYPLEASSPTGPQQRPKGPWGKLECLAEDSPEFQEVVQTFYDTLDSAHSRIRIVRVERVLHPLLQQQYELHRERLEQRCEQRPVEHVLYHGTSVPAVPEICAYGFNRSFCGRNEGHGLLRYDSAVDCLRQPSIFVIFHDTQALPTHLITCERIPGVPLRDPSGPSGHSPDS